jgi:hypothetical protein
VLASSSHSVKLPTTTTPASDIATKSERLEQTRAPMTATMPKQLSLISHCPLCQPRAVSAALMPALSALPALPSCPRLRPLHCHATSIALQQVAHVPRLYRYTYMSVHILQYHTSVPIYSKSCLKGANTVLQYHTSVPIYSTYTVVSPGPSARARPRL